jgi:hypothetical protein
MDEDVFYEEEIPKQPLLLLAANLAFKLRGKHGGYDRKGGGVKGR